MKSRYHVTAITYCYLIGFILGDKRVVMHGKDGIKIAEFKWFEEWAMRLYFIILLSIFTYHSEAASVTYQVDHIAGNQWKYNYSIANDVLPGDIGEFTVFFALGSYENLIVGNTPVGWDSLVAAPDSALSADGFYDALALVSGISPNTTLSGFSVIFDYLLLGSPGQQHFEIINPITFDILYSGNTELASNGTVPEPGDISLFAIGLWLLRRNYSRKHKNDN
ncbi:hypothetical protein [Methylomonas methanica]|uniref:PEP-CTERM protein-sorting domain-containing protein n=1 Tax=Methylomonas methanica (strain DSM 25384 / MC09) TaxID=857087 RepID=G0A1A1_METMM|nr:hypothetical protein [Methylomonas methanica]AEG02521.1 hypothetical protein Metme_4170 [Methylomonas methanica MC09]